MKLGWPCWIGAVVEDLDAQRRFYRDVLGFAEIAVGPSWVHFDLGGGNLFELVRRNADAEYDRARYQVAFAVDDIESARNELAAAGVQPVTAVQGNSQKGRRWCYFRDPEGNLFALKERFPDQLNTA
jgi:catechol 2,3-dioxygenase-like lactoylglutathione lyase family enzyme